MLVVILSLPRSGTSALSQMLIDSGFSNFELFKNIEQNKSIFNKNGYWEDVGLNLLNDNLIRTRHGEDKSFLYTKNISLDTFDLKISNENFYYDITKNNLEIPDDYETNIKNFTGHEWDVWGITRMREDGKWYKCYSNYGLSNKNGMIKFKEKYEEKLKNLNKDSNYFIKDPRMIFNFDLWSLPPDTKYLIIERDRELLLRSLRNHYGPRLFTEQNYEGFNWVSNHFNYKIKHQEYDNYIKVYESFIDSIKTKVDYLELNFNDNNYLDQIKNISEYLDMKIKFENIINQE